MDIEGILKQFQVAVSYPKVGCCLSPAGWLEHHRYLGRGQLQRDAAGSDGALSHLAVLFRLRQRRLQELQQQRHPGGSVGARPAVAGLLPEQDGE